MPENPDMRLDTLIVGGGPAGLSAALVLGRCGRRVEVIDAGTPRNAASQGVHNLLTRDGTPPGTLLAIGREEVEREGVRVRTGVVRRATCEPGGFVVTVEGSQGAAQEVRSTRTLLLATGVMDELPDISNVRAFYGVGVHHCPYCDARTYRGRSLVAIGPGLAGLGMALNLRTWSSDVAVVVEPGSLGRRELRDARLYGVRVVEGRIARCVSVDGHAHGSAADPLGSLVLEDGSELPASALFFNTEKIQRSHLPIELGCRMNEDGGVVHDRKQRTGVPGLYLAGDASFDVQFVVVAMAEGAKAGVAINRDLQDMDREAIRTAAGVGKGRSSKSRTRA